MTDGTRKGILVSFVVIAIALAAVMIMRVIGGGAADSVSSLTADVTVVCEETSREWTMSRGRIEQALYQRPGMLDPDEGLVNSETGKSTGFPKSRKRDWDDVIARINAEKQAIMEKNRK